MRHVFAIALLIAIAFAETAPGQTDASFVVPRPTPANVEAWRRHILPTDAERAFEKIPWIPSVAAGIAESRRTGKPLLFWGMNGHPLGCT